MRKKNTLYTVNKWNQPLFLPEKKENLFDGLTGSSRIKTINLPTFGNNWGYNAGNNNNPDGSAAGIGLGSSNSGTNDQDASTGAYSSSGVITSLLNTQQDLYHKQNTALINNIFKDPFGYQRRNPWNRYKFNFGSSNTVDASKAASAGSSVTSGLDISGGASENTSFLQQAKGAYTGGDYTPSVEDACAGMEGGEGEGAGGFGSE